MLKEKHFKEVVIIGLVVFLFFLAALILRPVIFSIIFAILLAYISFPVYSWVLKKLKSENLSAFFVCLLLLLIVLIPIVVIFSSLVGQAINLYVGIQTLDFTTLFKDATPSFFNLPELTTIIASSLNSYVPKIIAYFISKFSDFILNLPTILLQFFVILFVFFFSLRDGKKAIDYLKSLSPLSKEVENRFFNQFRDITNSVLLGQVVVGILQGLIAGIGYFIFGVPYALFLTLLTMLVGIIPLIGPWLVWIPVNIYLFMMGHTGAGLGLLIYGLVVISWLDTIVRPVIVSRRTEINSAIVIIGMIGGLFVFGILRLILGPLILVYVLLVLEIYRKKKLKDNIFLKEVNEEPKIKIP